MSWRANLTDAQRDLVSRMEAAHNARRIITRDTEDCINCEAWWNASDAHGYTVWCNCVNGQRLKALYAQQLQEQLVEQQRESAAAARRAKACTRCGGSGMYGHHGGCFRCNGIGVDPKYLKK